MGVGSFQSRTLVVLVCLIGLLVGLWPIVSGMFPVTFDQGRDWLWVKNQFDLGRPSLIGPAGSIRGVFFGPLWFWLLAVPYLISGGHPLVMTLFNALIVYSGIVLAALIFKKHDQKLAWLILILGFGSPALHGLANHAFSQHLLPILTLLFIYSLVKNKFVWASLAASLMWHAEPPIAVFSVPLLIYRAIKQKISLRVMTLALLAFVIPFLPLLAFDLRHDWIQLRSLLDFLAGNTRGLQEIRPLIFWERLLDRPQKFWAVWQQGLGLSLAILAPIMSFFTKSNRWLRLTWMYLATLMIIFIFYPHDLKLFYLDGVRLLLILVAAFWLKKLPLWLVVVFVLINLVLMKPSRTFNSLYINQVEAIDKIYQDAGGDGFKVYTFVPAIYDYNWQYLWFWRGLNQYGYLPEDFSYWPNVPEYVPHKNNVLTRFSDKIKPAGKSVYLIVTSGSVNERAAWFSRFNDMNWVFVNQSKLPDNTMITKFESR